MAISASRIAMTPNSKAPPIPPMTAPSGMKVKNTSIPLSPSKLVVLKISAQARPAPIPSAAPPRVPNAKPNRASNAIFICSSCPQTALRCVTEGAARFNGVGDYVLAVAPTALSFRDGAPAPDLRCASSTRPGTTNRKISGMTAALDLFRLPGQHRADVPLQHLFDQIEGVDDLPDLGDQAVAQRGEGGDVELHHAPIAALAEEHANKCSYLVTFGDQNRCLPAHLGISGVNGSPHLAHRGLALAVAHMRQQIDRGVGGEFDVVGAARQRAVDVAGIKHFEEIQHALTVKLRGHP